MGVILLLYGYGSRKVAEYRYRRYCIRTVREWEVASDREAARLRAFHYQFLTPKQKNDRLIADAFRILLNSL